MNLVIMHTPETSFIPYYVLMAKDANESLANKPLVNTALVILVINSALTQLSFPSQTISDLAFPDYVTIISFRKWEENW